MRYITKYGSVIILYQKDSIGTWKRQMFDFTHFDQNSWNLPIYYIKYIYWVALVHQIQILRRVQCSFPNLFSFLLFPLVFEIGI